MAKVKNTMKLINSTLGKIDEYYDMTIENMNDIVDASNEKFDLISYGFRFGYAQGMKAARNAMKKASV